MIFLKKMLYYL